MQHGRFLRTATATIADYVTLVGHAAHIDDVAHAIAAPCRPPRAAQPTTSVGHF
jgi:hypothetical protein